MEAFAFVSRELDRAKTANLVRLVSVLYDAVQCRDTRVLRA